MGLWDFFKYQIPIFWSSGAADEQTGIMTLMIVSQLEWIQEQYPEYDPDHSDRRKDL